MAKFSKYNNPAKKSRKVGRSYTDRFIDRTKEMLIDKQLGYEISVNVYSKIASNN